jgi:hypothetical protein
MVTMFDGAPAMMITGTAFPRRLWHCGSDQALARSCPLTKNPSGIHQAAGPHFQLSKTSQKPNVSKGSRKRVFGQGEKTLRAGLYARVSTHDQQTLPMQLTAMREYARKRGWAIAVEIKDVGSGASVRQKREELLDLARRRDVDLVVVWRLDRRGRGARERPQVFDSTPFIGSCSVRAMPEDRLSSSVACEDHYVVTPAGRLLLVGNGWRDDPQFEDSQGRPPVDVNFHGDIQVLSDDGHRHYTARFTHGTLEWIRPLADDEPWNTVAAAHVKFNQARSNAE